MQEHYTSHQQNPSYSPPADLKNTSGDRRKRAVAQYAPFFDLTTLNGSNGFVVNGLSNNDHLGRSVSMAGTSMGMEKPISYWEHLIDLSKRE